MKRTILRFSDAVRHPLDVKETMTVGELKNRLMDFDDDMPIVMCNADNTFGAKYAGLTFEDVHEVGFLK